MKQAALLSVIVPVLNEADQIEAMLAPLQPWRGDKLDVILVDGGSTDDTVSRATPWVDTVLCCEPGRARQMQQGVNIATGEMIWLLHADSRIGDQHIAFLLGHAHTGCWGRFDLRLSGRDRLFRVIEYMINVRSRVSGIATGDQGIFVSRRWLEQVGGVPQLPLMEDVQLSHDLKALSPPLCVSIPLETSSRRWEQHGIFSTIWLMWRLRFDFWRGVPASQLYHRYYGKSS